MSKWQPIETAPNNKSVILGKEGTPLMVTARRHGPISGWRHCHSSDEVCFEPTHWRHYPNPPGAGGMIRALRILIARRRLERLTAARRAKFAAEHPDFDRRRKAALRHEVRVWAS